jgi:predicted RNase H-like nuclease
MRLAGVDLAWQGEKNPSAIAIGDLNSRILSLT